MTAKRQWIMTLHGIRTRGAWQREIADVFSSRGHGTRSPDLGRIGLLGFGSRFLRERLIARFRNDYEAFTRVIQAEEGNDGVRPSIIAHSYGSYIVGAAMQRHSGIRFDKILVCGSILPRDFDWATLIGRNQVWRVLNEYGTKDMWPRFAHLFVPNAGNSGGEGFTFDSPLVTNKPLEGAHHSDFFNQLHYRTHWVPFIEAPAAPVHVETGSQVNDHATFDGRLEQSRAIDNICYAGLPGYEEAKIPPGLSKTWIDVNPDIYTYLLDARVADRVVGYVNAMPLVDQAFELVLAGELQDKDITADHIARYDPNAKLKLYLMSVAVLPKERRIGDGVRQSALEYMLFGLFARLAELERQGTRITEIGAVTWTAAGKKLCESIGMDAVKTGADDHVHYRLRIDPRLHARSSHPALSLLARRYAEGTVTY